MKPFSTPRKILKTCFRLARLVVTFSSCHTIEVHTTNVCLFSIAELPDSFSALHIDRNIFILDSSIREQPLRCEREISSRWKVSRTFVLHCRVVFLMP